MLMANSQDYHVVPLSQCTLPSVAIPGCIGAIGSDPHTLILTEPAK